MLRIGGDAIQVEILQLIMLEVAGLQPRALLEHQDGEAGLRQLARDDAARRARADHDEIHGLVGLNLRACQDFLSYTARSRCTAAS